MPSRPQLMARLRGSYRYEEVAEDFGIPPGVGTVASAARSHITYEQNQIWPRLADHLSDREAERLADLYLEARRKAPTRPHPHTPPRPPVLASVGTLMAGLDRARDALTGRTVPSPH